MNKEKLTVKYLEKDEIEAIVDQIHKGKSIKDYPFEVELFLYNEFKYRVMPCPRLEAGCKIDTALVACKKILRIDESIYEKQPKRARFSIAHEVGHLVLHKELIEMMVEALIEAQKTDDYASIINFLPNTQYRSAEWQADYFGGALLAPKSILEPKLLELIEERKSKYNSIDEFDDEDIDIIYHDLAKIFDVTKPAITVRLSAAELDYHIYL